MQLSIGQEVFFLTQLIDDPKDGVRIAAVAGRVISCDEKMVALRLERGVDSWKPSESLHFIQFVSTTLVRETEKEIRDLLVKVRKEQGNGGETDEAGRAGGGAETGPG